MKTRAERAGRDQWKFAAILDAQLEGPLEVTKLMKKVIIGPLDQILPFDLSKLPTRYDQIGQSWIEPMWPEPNQPTMAVRASAQRPSKFFHAYYDALVYFEQGLTALRLVKAGAIKILLCAGWNVVYEDNFPSHRCCADTPWNTDRQFDPDSCCESRGALFAPYGPPLEGNYVITSTTIDEITQLLPHLERARRNKQIRRGLEFFNDTYEYDRLRTVISARDTDYPKHRTDPIDKLLHTWASLECILTDRGEVSAGWRHRKRASQIGDIKVANLLARSWEARNAILHGDEFTENEIRAVADETQGVLRLLLLKLAMKPDRLQEVLSTHRVEGEQT